jgi:hypothetical protein
LKNPGGEDKEQGEGGILHGGSPWEAVSIIGLEKATPRRYARMDFPEEDSGLDSPEEERESEQAVEPSPCREAIQRAQALVRVYIPDGYSLSDELIEERRNSEE